MERDIEKDKPLDWIVLLGSIVFVAVGVLAPFLLIEYGGVSPTEWGWHSWQVYVSILCFVTYFALGKVALDMRKDDETD